LDLTVGAVCGPAAISRTGCERDRKSIVGGLFQLEYALPLPRSGPARVSRLGPAYEDQIGWFSRPYGRDTAALRIRPAWVKNGAATQLPPQGDSVSEAEILPDSTSKAGLKIGLTRLNLVDRHSYQRILQLQRSNGVWEPRFCCRTKEALIRCCGGSTLELDVLPDRCGDPIAPITDRSCPVAWCSWRRVTAFAGESRAGQLAIAGRLTVGSSLNGAMVSSVM
jgi:hypothetical protein